MADMGQFEYRWCPILLIYLLFVGTLRAQSLTISYCSPENNAGGYQANYAQFQSTGLCGDTCQGSYAFAVIQGNNCWCSNYVPEDQQNLSDCSEPCPGIDTEWCGSESSGLFGYFLLPAGNPLGTSGTGATQPGSTSSSSVSTFRISSVAPNPVPSSSTSASSPRFLSPLVTIGPPQSSRRPDTSSSSVSTVYTTPTPTESSTSFSTSTLTSETPTPSPTEVYTSVTTVTGQVRTVLVTPTADATMGQSSISSGSGTSAGKIAGIVVGTVGGIALIAAIVFFCLRRKRRQEKSPEGSFTAERVAGSSGATSNTVPSRQVSQLSSAGLLGKAPRIQTNFAPSENDPRSAGTTASNGVDRRSLGTDQRLNPWALYSQDDRLSSVSLQDNQDYSRQLRIANPD